MNHSEEVQPPLVLHVTIDGNASAVNLDEQQSIEIDGKAHQIQIASSPHRVFHAAGLKFCYPSVHNWEFDNQDPAATMWTMDGNSNVIMLMRFNGYPIEEFDELCDTLVDEFSDGYGEENIKVVESAISLGKRGVAGKRLEVSMAGEQLKQEIFTFRNSDDVFALMIQDSPGEDGLESTETHTAKEMLSKSFEFES